MNPGSRGLRIVLSLIAGAVLLAAAVLVTVFRGKDAGAGEEAKKPSATPSVALSAAPSVTRPATTACLTAAQFYDVVRPSLDQPSAFKVYGNVVCQDGWATAAVGAVTPAESPENIYYLLQQKKTGWAVAASGTEGWLFDPKPLCQRLPKRITDRLCLNG
jgi:hypothetical protein